LANTSSARKRVRAAERKHDRNRSVRSAVRTAVAKARRAVGGEEAPELGRLATSALDKAAEHGVLHPRNAARRKSRLMRALAAATAVQTAAGARRASAQGTRSKSTASQRKTSAGKAKPVTKTVRTAQRSRRSAGSEAERD
jgi:small subunit ribosomal protein S20